MADYKPIPVQEAKRLAVQYDKSMIVILAYDPLHGLTHTTTYGVAAFDSSRRNTSTSARGIPGPAY